MVGEKVRQDALTDISIFKLFQAMFEATGEFIHPRS